MSQATCWMIWPSNLCIALAPGKGLISSALDISLADGTHFANDD